MSENINNHTDIKDKKESDKEQEIISIPLEPQDNFTNSNNESQINKILCDFIIKEKIGEGTFSTVKVAENRQTNEKVAIKIMQKNKIILDEDKKRLEREIQVLKILRHPNLVQLYSVVETDEKIYLIMEYIKGIELFDYIVNKKKLQEREANIFFQQIISGIEYLHKVKYIHRDIKPENILIKQDTKKLTIVDFGLSNKFNNSKKDLFKSACGSPSYAAPEMLNEEKYSGPPVDIWSSGVVLYAMLCGYLPFEDDNNDELYNKIIKGKFDIPKHVSDKAKDLLHKILVTDPKKRLTISQIKNHPWFQLYNTEGKNKINLSEGLDLSKYIIPIDEDIVKVISKKYNINEEEIRISILANKHNDISTIYYLYLNKKINNNKKSVADYRSDLFKKYIQNDINLLKNYNKDINIVIEQRKNGNILNQTKAKKIKKEKETNFSESKKKRKNTYNSEEKYKKLDIKLVKNDVNINTSNKKNNKSQKKVKNKLEELHINYSDDKRLKKYKFKRYKTPNKLNNKINMKRINNSEISDDNIKNLTKTQYNFNYFSESIPQIIKNKLSMKIIYEEKKPLYKKEYQYKKNIIHQKKLKLFSYNIKKSMNTTQIRKKENENIKQIEHLKTEEKIKHSYSINNENKLLISNKQPFIYEPFDLNSIYIKPRNILKEQLISLFNKNKIKYRLINNMKCIIELKKENIEISLNFEKLKRIDDEIKFEENKNNINVIKIKRLGGYSKNLNSFEKIIFKLNSCIVNQ